MKNINALYTLVMKGLLLCEIRMNLIEKIDNSGIIKRLVSDLKCITTIDKTVGSFDNRYQQGFKWE